MKKAVCLLLCAIALISISSLSLAGNAEQSFDDWLINDGLPQMDGWEVYSSALSGKIGTAIATKTDGESVSRMLIVANKRGNSWETQLMNRGAVHNIYYGGSFVVAPDSDDTLILSYVGDPDSPHIQQYFNLKDGAWRFAFSIAYYTRMFEGPSQPPVEVIDEVHTLIEDGELSSFSIITDKEGNILTRSDTIRLPNVLDSDELLLITWDNMDPPISPNGFYRTDDSGEMDGRYLKAIFDELFDADYTYVDGLFTAEKHLQFIADTTKGDRVLLCGAPIKNHGLWSFTQSTPLPEGTRFGIENFRETLNIGGLGYGVSITRYANGTWGPSYGLGESLFTLGQVWAGSDMPLWAGGTITIGDNPWCNITVIEDWTSIPKTYKAAASGFSVFGWATPNNPNPEDRLHLRTKADKNSTSLGKYYNGTPVDVIQKGKEWSQVCIGNTVGYMMTEYLAFGKDTQKVETAFKRKDAAVLPVRVQWDDGTQSRLTDYEVAQWVVIGVKDDYSLVWNPYDNHYGTVHGNELWDGNG